MSLWLVGAGKMAQDYAKVLLDVGEDFQVIGRSSGSAETFTLATGVAVKHGGLDGALAVSEPPQQAIVAVGVELLASVATKLLRAGTRRILVEKPAGLSAMEIDGLRQIAAERGAEVLVAYNRRFYASTMMARQLIAEDGGPTSCTFEFTEWSHVIDALDTAAVVKKAWFLANSTHVVDLAFHLCGIPREWRGWHAGALQWHPSAARFCGAGITDRDVFFSYHADWEAPGRWGVEVLTRKRRFILRPMEQLQVIVAGTVRVDSVQVDDECDKRFKPGLYRQTKAFLNRDVGLLCTVEEQVRSCAIYEQMAGYGTSKS